MPQAEAPRRRGAALPRARPRLAPGLNHLPRDRPPRPEHSRARSHRPGPGRQAAPQGQAAPPRRGPEGRRGKIPGGDAHIREARCGRLPLAPWRLGGRHHGGPRGWRPPRHARGPRQRVRRPRRGRRGGRCAQPQDPLAPRVQDDPRGLLLRGVALALRIQVRKQRSRGRPQTNEGFRLL